jgi:hypothetical protein
VREPWSSVPPCLPAGTKFSHKCEVLCSPTAAFRHATHEPLSSSIRPHSGFLIPQTPCQFSLRFPNTQPLRSSIVVAFLWTLMLVYRPTAHKFIWTILCMTFTTRARRGIYNFETTLNNLIFSLRLVLCWVLTPCSFVGRWQGCGETYCLHLQNWSIQPWKWRQYASPKPWHRPKKVHGAKTQTPTSSWH